VKVCQFNLHTELLQPTVTARLAQLRRELASAPAVQPASPPRWLAESDAAEQKGLDGKSEARASDEVPKSWNEYAKSIRAGEQVVILMDEEVEGIPFYIGNIVEADADTLTVDWFSPRNKNVKWKWTADYTDKQAKRPAREVRRRDHAIPTRIQWRSKFDPAKGAVLTAACLDNLLDHAFEVLAQDAQEAALCGGRSRG